MQKQEPSGQQASTDRISAYQNKLSSMREKFQQRKSVGDETQFQNRLTEKPQASTPLLTKNQQVAGSAVKASGQNLGSSFSAMNNSLSKKWNEFKSAKMTDNQPSAQKDMSSTMMAAPTNTASLLGAGSRATTVTVMANPSAPLTGSLGASGAAGGASN